MELWVLKYEPNVEQSKGEKWKNLAHQEKIRGVGSSENENKKVKDRHRDREKERRETERGEREILRSQQSISTTGQMFKSWNH